MQRWLGHHSAAFTLATYVHLLPDEIAAPLDIAFRRGVRCRPMPLPAPNLTIKRLNEHQHSLELFRVAYRQYLDRYFRGTGDAPQRRSRVTALIPAAHLALQDVGMDMIVTPPPMLGGPVRRGLPNCAFAHEVFPEGPMPKGIAETSQTVLDAVEQAIGFLKEREKATRAAYRRPTYWGDRFLRAVVGFPAYLASLLSGKPRREVEGSRAGGLLHFAGALLLPVAAIATIAGTGHAFGWW